jgi:hypothetical protein
MIQIVDKKFGEGGEVQGSVSLKIEGGKLVVGGTVGTDKFGVEGQLNLVVTPKALGELLKKAIPGQIDDAIIDVMVAALEKV